MSRTKLILVGGFLGAGKTTLLRETAKRLMKQGLRVGLITNDQAPELVDSALLSLSDLEVTEVSGSCFCCNFNGFTDAIRKIRSEQAADVIIAEPVGSCTDLSATIIQPLKQYWNSELQVTPLSVLADPSRLASILDGGHGGLHPDAAYIYRKQLEESDIILMTKVDLLDKEAAEVLRARLAVAYPSATIRKVSALSGEGLDEWMSEVIVLALAFDGAGCAVGHVKIIVENGKRFTVGNLTGDGKTLSTRGSAGCGEEAKLIVNARVETTPERLDKMIRSGLIALIEGKYTEEVIAWKFLQPGRPQPTHRFSEVVMSEV